MQEENIANSNDNLDSKNSNQFQPEKMIPFASKRQTMPEVTYYKMNNAIENNKIGPDNTFFELRNNRQKSKN